MAAQPIPDASEAMVGLDRKAAAIWYRLIQDMVRRIKDLEARVSALE